jgi:raffinose/stachyose/melibiose transport system permease protein
MAEPPRQFIRGGISRKVKMRTDKRNWMLVLFILPGLLLYTVLQIYPLLQSVYYSFFSWKGFGEMIPMGLANYIKIFTDDYIIKIAFRNIFLFSAVSLVVMLPLSFMLAYSLNAPIRFAKTFSVIFYVPGVISTVIIGVMWGAILNFDTGFINTLLRQIGLGSLVKVWLGDPKLTIFVIILVNAWQWAGYHMLIFFASLQAIPEDLYEAAMLDGAGKWQRLFRLTIPLMTGSIKMNMILIIIGSFKCFDIVYTMTYGGPADSTQMLATYMYHNTFRRFNFGYGSSIAMIIFILCITCSLLLQRWRLGNEEIQY